MARNNRTRLKTPEVCPVCGEDVPARALACPECGADHNSGWREDAETYAGLDLPDEDFDYDKFVREEFGSSPKPAGIKTIWWITAILVLVASIALYFLTAR
ncbi:MAG TPA: zinc ribbon domain-containing protein [Chthoniobacterales bacterium]|nr:zinc ribbon domain-containing protein [Chthoniobacterales bacterium]